ncbi:MAG TPA: hypothetical protein VEO54_31070 [Thermoanaerobaculia bacterium]|nr:hypothetical protein [Thermoanaerobaculia bacterium]
MERFTVTGNDATGLTIVRARGTNLRFFANTSGAREGEMPHLHRIEWREEPAAVYGVQGIPRGAFVTVIDNVTFCYFEVGWAGLDTSEFSNALRVE